MANPWERQSSESEESYHAFKIYLEMEYPRRLKKVADIEGKSYQQMRIWSMRDKWASRARLYDNFYVREQVQKSNEAVAESLAAARLELLKQEWNDYKLMQEMWAEEFITATENKEMSISDLTKLTRMRMNIDDFGRRALHLPLTYSAKEQIDEIDEDDAPLLLDWNGIVERPLLGEETAPDNSSTSS